VKIRKQQTNISKIENDIEIRVKNISTVNCSHPFYFLLKELERRKAQKI